jgi:HEAT repeat protein
VQLLRLTHVDNNTCRLVASSLGEIDPGNEKAIAALLQLLQSNNTCWQVASSLGKIGIGNENAIAALVLVVLLNHVDDDTRSQAAFSLGKILQDNKYFFEVVKTLSGYWIV